VCSRSRREISPRQLDDPRHAHGNRRPIALVCSSGGHLAQLLPLRPWWSTRRRFWVSFDKPDARAELRGERRYWCHYPTNRNLWNLLRNTILALRICFKERPQLIVSTGAGVAVPFFYVGKLVGARTVYIEVVDRIERATVTGRLVRPVTDLFLVQWEEQLGLYPRSRLVGRLL
jgi:beta-1,4-N-acetylglucosaminyltransferase